MTTSFQSNELESVEKRIFPRTWPVRVTCAVVIAVALTTVGARVAQTSARNDFTQDYLAARAFMHGQDPYGNTRALANRFLGAKADLYEEAASQRNPHPPAVVLLMVPFSALPYSIAIVLWRLLIAFGIVAGMYLVCRTLSIEKSDSVLIGITSLIIPSAQSELLYGNATALILVLLALSFDQSEHSAQGGAGLAGGFATALKLFPGLLIVTFLKGRKFRAATWLMGSALIVTAISMALMWLDSRARVPIGDPNFAQFRSSPWNLSLPSMAFRVASGVPAVVLAGCIALLCLAVAVRSAGSLSGPFCNMIPWMILISPLSWYALLMVPVVTVAMIRLSFQSRLRAWHLLLFAAASFGTLVPIGAGPTGARETILGLIPTTAILLFALLDAFGSNGATPDQAERVRASSSSNAMHSSDGG